MTTTEDKPASQLSKQCTSQPAVPAGWTTMAARQPSLVITLAVQ